MSGKDNTRLKFVITKGTQFFLLVTNILKPCLVTMDFEWSSFGCGVIFVYIKGVLYIFYVTCTLYKPLTGFYIVRQIPQSCGHFFST